MANRISIRRGKRPDGKGFLTLLVGLARFEKLEPPTSAAQARILRDVFDKGRANLFLALRGKAPIGYALFFYTYSSFLAKPTLYLEDIFVLEEFRGLGVGKSLFLRCVKEASIQRCGRMEWSVLNWNKEAIRFYRNLGAKRLGEWSVYRLTEKNLSHLKE